jgi:hypothetical protein
LRYLLKVSEGSAAEADEAAVIEGELLATEFLETRDIRHKPLSVSATCLDDVKLKRLDQRLPPVEGMALTSATTGR